MLLTLLRSGGASGTLAATEAGADDAALLGAVLVSGSLAASEPGNDSAAAAGTVLVAGSLAAPDAPDGLTATGSILVSGAFASLELADQLAASGSVLVRGAMAVAEAGDDQTTAFGVVLVSGALSSAEQGQDGAAGTGTLAAPALSLTPNQALLLRKLHALHGLASPLTVSQNARVAGDVEQSITDDGAGVTIETTGGNDTFFGDVGTMIEELAALHGLTAPMTATGQGRIAGAVVQLFATSGDSTTVTRQ